MAATPYQAYKTLFLKRRRPDKRKRHPAIGDAGKMPDGGSALSGLREQQQKSPSRYREGLCANV